MITKIFSLSLFIMLTSLFYVIFVKLPFQLRQVTYLFVSVALICLVLNMKKIIISEICISYCLNK